MWACREEISSYQIEYKERTNHGGKTAGLTCWPFLSQITFPTPLLWSLWCYVVFAYMRALQNRLWTPRVQMIRCFGVWAFNILFVFESLGSTSAKDRVHVGFIKAFDKISNNGCVVPMGEKSLQLGFVTC